MFSVSEFGFKKFRVPAKEESGILSKLRGRNLWSLSGKIGDRNLVWSLMETALGIWYLNLRPKILSVSKQSQFMTLVSKSETKFFFLGL